MLELTYSHSKIQLFILAYFLVDRGGLEPPESLNTRFTVSPATSYGLPIQKLLMVQKEGFEPSKS